MWLCPGTKPSKSSVEPLSPHSPIHFPALSAPTSLGGICFDRLLVQGVISTNNFSTPALIRHVWEVISHPPETLQLDTLCATPWISSTSAYPEASRKSAIQTNSAGVSKMNSCNNAALRLDWGLELSAKPGKTSQPTRELPNLQLGGHVALCPPALHC